MNGIIKIGVCSIAMLIVCLLGTAECRAAAQSDGLTYSFHFRQGGDMLMKDYRGNKHAFEAIEQLISARGVDNITSIKIIGATSPEGTVERNKLLTSQRAKAVRNYILWRWKELPKSTVEITEGDNAIAWLVAVEADAKIPDRDKAIAILKKESSIPTKWANIQLLKAGTADYMQKQIFPLLRNAVACVVSFELPEPTEHHEPEPLPFPESEPQPEQPAPQAKPEVVDTVAQPADKIVEVAKEPATQIEPMGKPNKPLFALKTNLLFDAATLLNVELEVPIGKRFSVAAELIFPWWLWEGKQNCIQMMSGNVEGRYWFGDRSQKTLMTGWYAGVYAGGGYYDLEWNRKGYQGEFYIAAGISGGYAHTINKSGTLRMEYGIGVGYMSTHYRRYEAKFLDLDDSWHIYRQDRGKFTWFGPTRAKVSLVWMLDTNLFKKRGGRK